MPAGAGVILKEDVLRFLAGRDLAGDLVRDLAGLYLHRFCCVTACFLICFKLWEGGF